ncbi:MAG: PhaM family polyhydroxyalkanoate granule multifunctional regulatory protein, partial [Burkholderiaceae bacterium]
MATQNQNPFVLPGFGQSGDMAGNPLMASMEMMRQAWQGLAGSAGLEQVAMGTPASLEELDRRIADLRAVENWLRMNLSMLSSTIQGLEVQRATISTLKSFMGGAATGGAQAGGPSPLEQVLGIKPAADKSTAAQKPEQAAPGAGEAYTAQAAAAAQGWWDMLQKQFDSLAAATSATLQGAEAAAEATRQAAAAASSDSTLGKGAGKA